MRKWGIAICVIFFLTTSVHAAEDQGVDLIQGHDWAHMSGVKASKGKLEVLPLDRRIISKIYVPDETDMDEDEEKSTPNPPINLRGPYLEVDGDFAVIAQFELPTQKGAYLNLYETLPIIQDEWRQEGRALSLGIKNGSVTVSTWDGESGKAKTKKMGKNLKGKVKIQITKEEDAIYIEANENLIGEIEGSDLFEEGNVYFGLDAEKGGGFSITSLYATDADVQDIEIPTLAKSKSAVSLASVSDPLYIGSAVAALPLMTDTSYQKIVSSELNMVTPENDMKFQFIHPQRNQYAFGEADAIVDFAEKNNMKVHGHTLAWHEAVPEWVTSAKKSDVKSILEEHIQTVVGRYKGRISEWDVVNEPIRDENIKVNKGLRGSSPWFKAMGEQYIDIAFKKAHEADPDARLYLNEYGVEAKNEKSDVLYALVKRLLDRGVPIHGIGFQVHEDVGEDSEPITAEEFKRNMKRFTDLGLEVRVSEMDVNIHGKVNKNSLAEQADLYTDIFKLMQNEKKSTGFSTWGITDRYSSLQYMDEYDVFGNGLLFDEDYKPKKAYSQMIGAANSNDVSEQKPTKKPDNNKGNNKRPNSRK